tara:strand:+ start:2264 stop:2971 length:708 start_codon:yes stop_codon:yes gene_type:complete
MDYFFQILLASINLILNADSDLFEIIFLSLKVSLTSLFFSCLIGLPIAALCVIKIFFGKNVLIIFFNSLMGLPPVLVGLVLYLVFSKSGPLGFFEILYTPTIMMIAQFVLIIPIIVSMSIQVLEQILNEYEEMLTSMGAKTKDIALTILWDARFALITCILAGLGRALSEVGAIIIVGGNIAHHTRVMTTSIALETSKGNLELAVSLGLILIFISLSLNLIISALKKISRDFSYD